MKLELLPAQIALGEDFSRQFNANVKNVDSQASKMAAFANSVIIVLSGHIDSINDLTGMEPAV